MRAPVVVLVSLALTRIAAGQAIADNSFLLEEAYNQEPGVVQHISGLLWRQEAGSWQYSFTQEWPIVGQAHQLSYTVPVQRSGGTGSVTGVGDLAVNYRYQLIAADARVAVSPRLTLLLPTGREQVGMGAGGVGIQVNLPASATLASHFVAHGNAGATLTPRARDALGNHASANAWNLGGSVIWLARSTFNVMVEVAWSRSDAVTGPGSTAASDAWLVSPGIRWAHNFKSGLQIVPGIAFPVGVGPSRGDHAVFFYLSFEHPYRRAH